MQVLLVFLRFLLSLVPTLAEIVELGTAQGHSCAAEYFSHALHEQRGRANDPYSLLQRASMVKRAANAEHVEDTSARTHSEPGGSGEMAFDRDGRGATQEEVQVHQEKDVFCTGMATTMQMKGFSSMLLTEGAGNRDCVVFLFHGLVMDRPWKFALGCLAAASLGFLAAGMIALQRAIDADARRSVKLCLYGATLLLGYALMLLVMVYSVELIFSVVAGLVLGRLVFEMQHERKGQIAEKSEVRGGPSDFVAAT